MFVQYRIGKIYILGFAVLLVFSFGCSPKPSKYITDDDNGSRVEIAQGEVLGVKLKVQMGTGFTWKVVSQGAELTQMGNAEVSDADKKMPGGAEYQIFKFKAAEKGEVHLKLQYCEAWKKDAKPEKDFTATVVIQ